MEETKSEYRERRRTDLRQKQALPLRAKVLMSQQRIREWYEHWNGDVYVAYSGGKDSTVLLHLVKELYPDVPAVFVNTGLEYPELRQHAVQNADVVLKPEMRFDQVVKTLGYPVVSKEVCNKIRLARENIADGKYSLRLLQLGVRPDEYGGLKDSGRFDYAGTAANSKFSTPQWRRLLDAPFKVTEQCCDIMKKRPFHLYELETGRKAIIGTMATESMARETAWHKTGCNAFDGRRPLSKPLSFWTEQDILEYLLVNGIPIPSMYGEIVTEDGQYRLTGVQRTGCMFCAFGAHREGTPNRFQQMRITHPKQYEYCMKPVEDGGLGLGEVLDYMGIDR